MSGGDLVAEVLKRHGVPYLFTLCGGHISPILTGCKSRGIRVVDLRDERSVVFAADACARLTGIPGVAAVTAGPGVTNTITSLVNAKLAESPLVLFGGATATILKGRGALQDIDQIALIKAAVKKYYAIKSVRALPGAVADAMRIAASGVPGPVFIEVPVDLLYDETTVRDWYEKDAPKGDDLASRGVRFYMRQHLWRQFLGAGGAGVPPIEPPEIPTASDRELAKAADLLRDAKKPVLVAGGQTVIDARRADGVAAAIRKLGMPTYLGGGARGLLGKSDPLQMRHGRGGALKGADVAVVCGFPFDFRMGYGRQFGRSTKVIAINRDPAALTKNRTPTLAVEADAGRFLESLSERVSVSVPDWIAELRGKDDARDAEIAKEAAAPVDEYVNTVALCKGIEDAMSDDAVLVVDGGDFVATASYCVRPRTPLAWLDPGVFGTLGVGGGFTVAAALARPGREVWLLYGDGAAGYSLAEIDTCVRHGLAPIAVIGNNASWAQIAREQVPTLGDSVGCDLLRTAYEKVAEGYGGKGLLLDKPENIGKVLQQAKKLARSGVPVVINAMIKDTDFRKGSISI